MNIKNLLLKAASSSPTPHEVEGLGTVYLKTLSAYERNKLLLKGADIKNDPEKMAKFDAAVVAACVCDEDGTLAFTEEDVDALSQSNGAVISDVALAALSHNKIGQEQNLKKV